MHTDFPPTTVASTWLFSISSGLTRKGVKSKR
jgi:hypothetical protein